MSTPAFLSIVVVGRNDNYGGRFLTNLNQFVYNISTLLPTVELVLVEWNPPKDSYSLGREMFWPIGLQGRIITVAPEVHNILPNPYNLPLLEYYAKNVGIRRAQGDYILSTNPDTLLSASLADILNAETLEYGNYYRANRTDIEPLPRDIILRPINTSNPKEIIKHCKFGSYQGVDIHSRVGAIVRYLERAFRYKRLQIPHENASGDFMLMHRHQWYILGGYPELSSRSHVDSIMVCKAYTTYHEVILSEPFYHQEHNRPQLLKEPETIELKAQILQGKTELKNQNWGLKNHKLDVVEIT